MVRSTAVNRPMICTAIASLALLLSACQQEPPPSPSPYGNPKPASSQDSGSSRQQNRSKVSKVALAGPWKTVDADFLYTCALKDPGSFWCWGLNASGKLGDGTTTNRNLPTQVGSDTDWVAFSMADHLTCGVKQDQSLWCWGSQTNTRPAGNTIHTATNTTPVLEKVQTQFPPGLVPAETPGRPIKDVGLGDAHTCVLTDTAQILCIGDEPKVGSPRPLIGFDGWRPIAASLLPANTRFKDLSVGSKHSCGVTESDTAYCWGQNPRGQVGSGTHADAVPVPTPLDLEGLPGSPKIRQLAAGTFHTCALFEDNILACWGGNDGGCLGTGDANDRNRPAPMVLTPNLATVRWTQVDGGYHSTCALTDAGDIYCWGSNYCPPARSNAPAQGNTPQACGPEPMSGPSIDGKPAYSQLANGCSHACALNIQGDLYCWGSGSSGELGSGPLASPESPPGAP